MVRRHGRPLYRHIARLDEQAAQRATDQLHGALGRTPPPE